jgi:osmotically inducible protein OsmC
MPVRKADVVWEGGLKNGRGSFKGQSGQLMGKYSYGSRFEEAQGTNPEELLAAAEAGCFSMALGHALEKAGASPRKIETSANVWFEQKGDQYGIGKITLVTRAVAANIDQAKFTQLAEQTKDNCPISRALLGSVRIELDAKLVQEGSAHAR